MHEGISTRPPNRLASSSWPVMLVAVALMLAPVLANAAPSSTRPGAAPRALACLIQPDKMADVGSPVIGVVEWIEVERGDSVRKGQVVARLRADVERANTDVARSRAASEGDLRGALASLELAKIKRDRAVNLAEQNFVSQEAVDQAQSEMDVATERVKFSREQLATSSREFTASQAQVAQRVVRSPMDGVVIERHINAGERVEEKPMLRIADVSVLRVDVVAPISMFGTLDIGQELIVQPELPGAGPRRARIVQIDKVLDPASNTFRLRLSLPNSHSLLPAGLRCSVELRPQAAAAGSPSSSGGPAAAAGRATAGN